MTTNVAGQFFARESLTRLKPSVYSRDTDLPLIWDSFTVGNPRLQGYYSWVIARPNNMNCALLLLSTSL